MNDLPKWLTPDWLAKASLEERHTVWRNARDKGGAQGEAVAAAIETSGLAYTPRGHLTLDHPQVVRMHDIISSPEGRSNCIAAIERGEPALAGVERDLQAALGAEYCGANGTTQTAGYFVAEVIRNQGYVDAGQRTMPPGSTAKSARFFQKRK